MISYRENSISKRTIGVYYISMMMIKTDNKALTLMELLIILSIIGILVAIAIPNFLKIRNREYAIIAERDGNTIVSALSDYLSEHDSKEIPTIEMLQDKYKLNIDSNTFVKISGNPESLVIVEVINKLANQTFEFKATPTLDSATLFEWDRITDIARSLKKGVAAISAPKSMDLNDVDRAYLLLSLNQKLENLKEQLPEKHNKKGSKIKVSDRMQATLRSMAFEIDPESPEVQAVQPNETTKWSWVIKPKKHGKHNLTFTLSALGTVQNLQTSVALETYRETITVHVSLIDTIVIFLRENSSWIYPIIGVIFSFLMFVWGYFWRKSKELKGYSNYRI